MAGDAFGAVLSCCGVETAVDLARISGDDFPAELARQRRGQFRLAGTGRAGDHEAQDQRAALAGIFCGLVHSEAKLQPGTQASGRLSPMRVSQSM